MLISNAVKSRPRPASTSVKTESIRKIVRTLPGIGVTSLIGVIRPHRPSLERIEIGQWRHQNMGTVFLLGVPTFFENGQQMTQAVMMTEIERNEAMVSTMALNEQVHAPESIGNALRN